jgi:hypothetical protein
LTPAGGGCRLAGARHESHSGGPGASARTGADIVDQGMGTEAGPHGVIEADGRGDGDRGVDAVRTASGSPVSGVPDGCQANLTPAAIELVVAGLRGAVSAADPLARVEALRRARALLDSAYDSAVLAAREAGATWQSIGSAAGITRQTAQGRWGVPAGPPQPQEGQEKEEEPHLTPSGKGWSAGGRTHERVRLSLPGIPVAVTVDIVREKRPGRSRKKLGP